MGTSHRLNRLERHAPKPPQACPYCGIAQLKHGTGPVRPGLIVPESIEQPSGPMMLGCKSCFAWVRVDKEPTPNPDAPPPSLSPRIWTH